MSCISEGSSVKLRNGTVILIGKQISSGAQADVYHGIDIRRRTPVAIKHLYGAYCTEQDKEKYYRKCVLLAQHPPLHPDLVWMYDVSEFTTNQSFLYAMPLLEGYSPLSAIIKKPEQFSLRQRAELCDRLADIFITLHKGRFVYGDISGNNILYRVEQDGSLSIRVIDCDNIIPQNFNLGLSGTGIYRAPEVLLGDAIPTIQSDIHALAVLTFRIFCGRHPLDGNAVRALPFTPENVTRFFGQSPRFLFDGTSNPPSQLVQRRWNALPHPIQLYYQQVFSQDALHGRAARADVETFRKLLKMSFSIS